jgi:transposase
MYRIRLTADEERELGQRFTTTSERRMRDRCQAVLMAARGRARQRIAQDLGVHRTTLRLWVQTYRARGLAGLQIHWAPGPQRRIPAALAPTIVAWVKGGPVSCGLQRANWTYEELANYLYKQTGVRVKETAMREFCHQQQIRPYRPTYRYLRGDPHRQAQAQRELADVKKKPRPESVCC